MTKTKQRQNRSIQRVTCIGMVVNIALAGLKIILGLMVGSVSLLADGFHSLSDLATDVAVLVGTHLGAKEPDHEHPYGHGRLETFSAAFIALILVFVGGAMIVKASLNLAVENDEQILSSYFGSAVIWGAIISIIAKELMYRWTRNIAVKTHSAALYANAWHHRSDALSSIAVMIGAVAVLLGYPQGDAIAAIIVGLMIILVGVKVISGCLNELTERSVDAKTVDQIQTVIESDNRILGWHKLRTRSLGREIFVDFHILVDPNLNITAAHEIADALEQSLHSKITQPINVMVHIEPKTY
ncbi:MAG: cation diffusion facilitator family transporter [Planctomycetota bacterium]|jgi:cation diffusion facilitator family transporter